MPPIPPARGAVPTAGPPGAPDGSPTTEPVAVVPRTTLRSVELAVLVAVQRRAGHRTLVGAARGMGRFGDHAAGWLALGALGWLLDPARRRQWAGATTAVLGAHATTVVVKRVLRRARPEGVGITVHARTPSRLSFPSSHAASTTAAAVAYGSLLGVPGAPAVLAPLMGASRLLLGLHFPTDVAVGTAVGAVAGRIAVRRSGALR